MTVPGDFVVVFDLDDTLYLERDFVRSGYAAVAGWMQQRFGMTDFAERAALEFEHGDRTHVFDAVLAGYGLAEQPGLVATLVSLYRCHQPDIALAPDAADWLSRHRHERPLAIITDGPAVMQTNKLRALGLDGGGIAPLVCTGQWGRDYWKPHPRGFEHVSAHFQRPGAEFVYVADNPAKDFIAPRALGWRTVQIVRPGAVHAGREVADAVDADTVITSLDALDDWLISSGGVAAAAHAGER